MSAVDDILNTLDIDTLAAQVGAQPDEVAQAVRTTVPALLGGLHANAQDPAGEASLTEALGQHADQDLSLEAVDPADGERITRHVFGDAQDQVVEQLGAVPGVDKGLIGKLLPIIAPIVLAYVAKKVGAKGGALGGGAAGGIVGTILGELLKGAGAGARPQSAPSVGSIIGDLLGGLLGGGRR